MEAGFQAGSGAAGRSGAAPPSGSGSGSGQPALGGGPETDPERLLPDAGQSAASTSAGGRSLEEVATFLRDELPKTWKDGVCHLCSSHSSLFLLIAIMHAVPGAQLQ